MGFILLLFLVELLILAHVYNLLRSGQLRKNTRFARQVAEKIAQYYKTITRLRSKLRSLKSCFMSSLRFNRQMIQDG